MALLRTWAHRAVTPSSHSSVLYPKQNRKEQQASQISTLFHLPFLSRASPSKGAEGTGLGTWAQAARQGSLPYLNPFCRHGDSWSSDGYGRFKRIPLLPAMPHGLGQIICCLHAQPVTATPTIWLVVLSSPQYTTPHGKSDRHPAVARSDFHWL